MKPSDVLTRPCSDPITNQITVFSNGTQRLVVVGHTREIKVSQTAGSSGNLISVWLPPEESGLVAVHASGKNISYSFLLEFWRIEETNPDVNLDKEWIPSVKRPVTIERRPSGINIETVVGHQSVCSMSRGAEKSNECLAPVNKIMEYVYEEITPEELQDAITQLAEERNYPEKIASLETELKRAQTDARQYKRVAEMIEKKRDDWKTAARSLRTAVSAKWWVGRTIKEILKKFPDAEDE